MKKLIALAISFILLLLYFPQNIAKNETNYYAVIVSINDYNGTEADLNVPKEVILDLYNNLIEWENWKEENVILLVNENATYRNILNALDWLAMKAMKMILCFSYMMGMEQK